MKTVCIWQAAEPGGVQEYLPQGGARYQDRGE